MSAAERWEALREEVMAIDQSELPSADESLQARVAAALEGWAALQQMVDTAGTFSRNEELDDVHTLDLKFLLVPFYIAELEGKVVDEHRYQHLHTAQIQLTRFIAKCHDLGALSPQEFPKITDSSPVDRQSRIDRLKKDKELANRLGALEQAKRRAARRCKEDNLEDSSEYDELERTYQLLLLEQALYQAFDKRTMCIREMELLALSEEQKAEACAARDAAQAEARKVPKDPIRLVPSEPTERQRILDAVFQPRNLPTMTIEQYMKTNPAEFTPMPSAPQKPQEDEDEDKDEDDEETYKKRAWDDWKDDHPKGWGNRMGNVG